MPESDSKESIVPKAEDRPISSKLDQNEEPINVERAVSAGEQTSNVEQEVVNAPTPGEEKENLTGQVTDSSKATEASSAGQQETTEAKQESVREDLSGATTDLSKSGEVPVLDHSKEIQRNITERIADLYKSKEVSAAIAQQGPTENIPEQNSEKAANLSEGRGASKVQSEPTGNTQEQTPREPETKSKLVAQQIDANKPVPASETLIDVNSKAQEIDDEASSNSYKKASRNPLRIISILFPVTYMIFSVVLVIWGYKNYDGSRFFKQPYIYLSILFICMFFISLLLTFVPIPPMSRILISLGMWIFLCVLIVYTKRILPYKFISYKIIADSDNLHEVEKKIQEVFEDIEKHPGVYFVSYTVATENQILKSNGRISVPPKVCVPQSTDKYIHQSLLQNLAISSSKKFAPSNDQIKYVERIADFADIKVDLDYKGNTVLAIKGLKGFAEMDLFLKTLSMPPPSEKSKSSVLFLMFPDDPPQDTGNKGLKFLVLWRWFKKSIVFSSQ